MNRHFLNRVITLVAMLGLAVMGLLLVFLLLGQITVSATSKGAGTIPDIRAQGVTFTVSGTVTCEVTGGPISGVEVFVWDRDEGSGGFVGNTTNSSGYYSVTLESGNYDLILNPPCGSGCASQSLKGITGPPGQTRNVALTLGYSVSGTVFATDGTTPVEDVSIYAFNHDTADGFGLPPTDSDGHYCIGLVGGPYDLGFTPPACLGLGPTTISITVAQDITRNVVLTSGFTVAGCITDGAGYPVPSVQIYAYDPNIRGFGFAPSDESGCYTGTLPYAGTPHTGTYDIQFIPPPGLGLGSLTVIDVVSETADCPNTSLPITLPAGFTISGTVTCQGQPVKNVFVYADPVGGGAPGDDLVGWGVYSVDDGSYGLPVVPGTYDIKFIPPPVTGFNTVVISDVQVITDTVLDVDLCPSLLFLPVVFKNYPPSWITVTASGDQAWGEVGPSSFCNPDKYKVALYAKTDIWYVQPYDDSPDVQINSDCTWQSFTHDWYQIAAHLVPVTYSLPITIGRPAPPCPPLDPATNPNVLAASCYP